MHAVVHHPAPRSNWKRRVCAVETQVIDLKVGVVLGDRSEENSLLVEGVSRPDRARLDLNAVDEQPPRAGIGIDHRQRKAQVAEIVCQVRRDGIRIIAACANLDSVFLLDGDFDAFYGIAPWDHGPDFYAARKRGDFDAGIDGTRKTRLFGKVEDDIGALVRLIHCEDAARKASGHVISRVEKLLPERKSGSFFLDLLIPRQEVSLV